jgi:hypothetical protein
MVALFPVPGYLASMLRSTQVEKMKKVRASVLVYQTSDPHSFFARPTPGHRRSRNVRISVPFESACILFPDSQGSHERSENYQNVRLGEEDPRKDRSKTRRRVVLGVEGQSA